MRAGLKRGTVALVPHSGEWKKDAESAISVLKKVLGGDTVDMQHVGSTSVRGIMAKPIIDIAVGAVSFDAILRHNAELAEKGIVFRQQDVENQLLYVMGDFKEDTRTHHIHVVQWQGEAWINYLNFRDYLNENADMAQRYASLKEELAQKYPEDRAKYTEGKKELIDQILAQAKEWRMRR